jgi:hypothetical protein
MQGAEGAWLGTYGLWVFSEGDVGHWRSSGHILDTLAPNRHLDIQPAQHAITVWTNRSIRPAKERATPYRK